MNLPQQLYRPWLVARKAAAGFYHDSGYFLAMGLAFNLLLYFVPLLLLLISLLGYTVLESERAAAAVQAVVLQFLPHSQQAFSDSLASIVNHRGLLGAVGFFFFLIFASSLFGSVRHVLNIIFKVERRRGFWRGVAQDFLIMVVTAFLSVLAITFAALLAFARAFGAEHLPFITPALEAFLAGAGKLLGWLFLMAILFIFYRFAPARSLPAKATLAAALSAAIFFELARWAFGWYVGFARDALAIYGALAGLMLFFFWLYYASIIFVIGAEIGFACEEESERRQS